MNPAPTTITTSAARPYLNSELSVSQIRFAPEPSSSYDFKFDLDQAGQFLRSGLLVVTSLRTIIAGSRRAYEVLDGNEGLGRVNGCLLIEKAYVQRSFDLLLQQVRTATAAGYFDPTHHSCLGVPDHKGAVRYFIRVIDAQAYGPTTNIVLAITDLLDRGGGSRATFSTAFRLSEREAELAELFSQGFRLNEISTKMGVCLNTARVHLRNVFAKTNCSGQSELMRMLSRLSCFMAPLAMNFL